MLEAAEREAGAGSRRDPRSQRCNWFPSRSGRLRSSSTSRPFPGTPASPDPPQESKNPVSHFVRVVPDGTRRASTTRPGGQRRGAGQHQRGLASRPSPGPNQLTLTGKECQVVPAAGIKVRVAVQVSARYSSRLRPGRHLPAATWRSSPARTRSLAFTRQANKPGGRRVHPPDHRRNRSPAERHWPRGHRPGRRSTSAATSGFRLNQADPGTRVPDWYRLAAPRGRLEDAVRRVRAVRPGSRSSRTRRTSWRRGPCRGASWSRPSRRSGPRSSGSCPSPDGGGRSGPAEGKTLR